MKVVHLLLTWSLFSVGDALFGNRERLAAAPKSRWNESLRSSRQGEDTEQMTPATLDTTLQLRGGGDLKEGTVNFLTWFFAVHGLLGFTDAAKYWEPFNVKIKPNTIASASAKHNGSVPLAIFMVSILVKTGMDPVKAAVLSAVPCFLFFFEGLYSGTLEKAGFSKFLSPFMLVYIIAAAVGYFTGTLSDDIIKAMLMPLFGAGLLCSFLPEVGAALVGAKFTDDTDKLYFKIQGVALSIYGAMTYSLFYGSPGDLAEAWKTAMLVFGVEASKLFLVSTAWHAVLGHWIDPFSPFLQST